jgi:Icc-related predicted phosphoesterase
MLGPHALGASGGGVRILVVSDIHYSLPQFDWLLQRSMDYDLVVIAGDLLETNSAVDLSTQVVVVLKYLKRMRLGTQVLVCSGNHDLDTPNALGEMHAGWARSLRKLSVAGDGDTVLIGDVTITCCPWWDGPETLKQVGDQLTAAADERRGTWIWVYHAPPPDSPVSWNGHRYFGDQALTGWIAQHQPDIVLCGHVHEAPFTRNGSWVDRIGNTWLFNAGRQIGQIPATVSIDTKAREAAWFSFEGAESVKLDAPLVRPVEPLTAMPTWMPRAADPT